MGAAALQPGGLDQQNALSLLVQSLNRNQTETNRTPVQKAYNNYEELANRHMVDPVAIISEYREEALRTLRPLPGTTWSYTDVWRLQNFRSCQSTGRMSRLCCEAVDLLSRGLVLEAHALLIRGLQAAHQASLDNGSWDTAWLMTGLPDPFNTKGFGGTPEQLAKIAAYRRAQADLRGLQAQGGFQEPQVGEDLPAVTAEKKPPKKAFPKSPKAKGKGAPPDT
jgi:hypothetical protein